MKTKTLILIIATLACAAVAGCESVIVQSGGEDDPPRPVSRPAPERDGEYKEKYRDGPCKVEIEQKRDGSYKEERECKNVGPGPYRHPRGDYEEKYWDGPCRIEREWKRDGTFKEKIDCKEGSTRKRGKSRGDDDDDD